MFANIAQAAKMIQAIKQDDTEVLHRIIVALLRQEGAFSEKDYTLLRGDRGPLFQRQFLLEVARRGLWNGASFQDAADTAAWKETRERFFASRKRLLEEPLRVPAGAAYFEAVLVSFKNALREAIELGHGKEPKLHGGREPSSGRDQRHPDRHTVAGSEPDRLEPEHHPANGRRGYPAQAKNKADRKDNPIPRTGKKKDRKKAGGRPRLRPRR